MPKMIITLGQNVQKISTLSPIAQAKICFVLACLKFIGLGSNTRPKHIDL
jgi:hypothetical protein